MLPVPHVYGITEAALATTYCTRRYLMARGLPYSPEEDAILLSTHVTADIKAKLRAAGYPERSDNAIKQRRNDLRKNGGLLGMKFRQARPQSELVAAATDLEVAKADVERLKEQLAAAEAAVLATRKRLATAMAREH